MQRLGHTYIYMSGQAEFCRQGWIPTNMSFLHVDKQTQVQSQLVDVGFAPITWTPACSMNAAYKWQLLLSYPILSQ